jgi:hypothetical protein
MISMKLIMPPLPLLDADKILRATENALDDAAKDVRVDFLVTTETFDHKVEFTIDKTNGKREVYTTDAPYFYVNFGTSVRRALMSPDFKPKTRTGFIGSNQGRGGVVFISKKLNLPGIKAREFDRVIKEKWQKAFPAIMQRAIDAEIGSGK